MTQYRHDDTKIQREFESLYQACKNIEKAQEDLKKTVELLKQTINEVVNGNG